MFKINMCSFLLLLLSIINSSSSTIINCKFFHPPHPKTVYQCRILNNINIDSGFSATIYNVTGRHKSSMINNNVTSFYANNKNIQIFPFGLDKIFKNLLELTIRKGSLKRITQQNLLPFHNLTYLCLEGNLIQVIQVRLFHYNHELESIDLSNNPIFTINSSAFDNLPKLITLKLRNNSCIDLSTDYSHLDVKEVISRVKINCQQRNTKETKEAIQKRMKNFKYHFFNCKVEQK
ncbi:hypothetical protein ACKWTF_015674 [Chironomus riparius]